VAFKVAAACDVSLYWLATGVEGPVSANEDIDLDALTDDVWDACHNLNDCPVPGWDQAFDVLKKALGQPNAEPHPETLRPVAVDQRSAANTGDRPVVTPQAPTGQTHFVLTLPQEMQHPLLRRISEMAMCDEDAEIGAFIRGFFEASRVARGQ